MQESKILKKAGPVILKAGRDFYHGTVTDVEELNSIGPPVIKHMQIEPGRFLAKGIILVLPNMIVRFGSVNRGTVSRTLLEGASRWRVYGTLTPGRSWDFSQQTLGPGMLAIAAPNCEVGLYSGIGGSRFQLAVSPEFWVRTADALFPGGRPVMGTRIVPLSAALWATLLRRLNRVGEALQTSPDTLEEPHVRTSVEQGLVELLIMATAHPQEPFRLSASSRAMAMRRVRDYVQEHLEYPITLSDLCRAANLGARTLQIIFREKLRISPMQYVRAARLNRAHSVLHENLCRNVSDAARLSGYWHMAQFAVDYRRMFHETPSATLKRCRRRSSTNGFS